mmetsp:Transcript_86746/g.193149  ORF Transcript_86746/g.193149 Transcript_86746/m.193149 type:complete len:187 (+) Transcript_86746:3-563(+)
MAIFHEKACAIGAPDGSTNYEAHVFNFYVFPETGPVNMDGAGVHFNTKHGMDWNKWIKEGIPYVHREAAERLKDALLPKEDKASDEKKEAAPRSRMVLTKEADIETTGKAIAALRSWLADEANKDQTEFEVIEANAYLRRFMHETLAAEFPDLIVESRQTPRSGVSKMFVLRLTEAQKTERAAKAP